MDWLADELEELNRRALLRQSIIVEPESATCVRVDGRVAVQFCANDYLGLRFDPRLKSAAIAAVEREGTGAGASRLISGNAPSHHHAEREIADLVGQPTALLASSGFALNAGAIPALAGADDVVFSDALNHASIVDGCRLSKARTVVVPHVDLDALEHAIRAARPFRRGWVVTETLFSMDGDVAPLRPIAQICRREGLGLYLDEAHAIGTVGAGRGLANELGVVPDAVVGTLGKALGGSGAFIAGSGALQSFLWNRCRSFVFSTGIAPSAAAVAACAAQIARTDSEPRRRLHENVRLLRDEIGRRIGPPGGDPSSPIVPVRVTNEARAVAVSRSLLECGYFVQAIRPPTVPPNTARVRITVSAAHRADEIRGLVDALARSL